MEHILPALLPVVGCVLVIVFIWYIFSDKRPFEFVDQFNEIGEHLPTKSKIMFSLDKPEHYQFQECMDYFDGQCLHVNMYFHHKENGIPESGYMTASYTQSGACVENSIYLNNVK